jgi:hypothetical protein
VAAIEFVPWRGVKADNKQIVANAQPQTTVAAVSPTPSPAPDSGASAPVDVVATALPPTSPGAPAQTSSSISSSRPARQAGGASNQLPTQQTAQQTNPQVVPRSQTDPTTPQYQPTPQLAPPPAAPPGPSREEVMKAHEHMAKLRVRADVIRTSLLSLKRSQQSMGTNLNAKFTGPEGLMNTYMRSADDALNANDLAVARELADKAEHQIEILEKLLNL